MMEARTIAIIMGLSLVVLASGCTDGTDGELEGSTSSSEDGEGQGLEIVDFKPADTTLYPDQKSTIVLELRNHHISESVSIDNMELYNRAPIEILGRECIPEELEPADHDLSPTMECTWNIQAPSEDEIGDFNSKLVQPKLQLRYDSELSNKRNPLKIQFRPYEAINDPEEVTETYSNGEVQMQAAIEDPAPLGGTKVSLDFSNVGEGKIIPEEGEDTNTFYTVNFLPEAVFTGEDCGGSQVPVTSPVTSDTEISCEINPGSSSEVLRNLVFATSYKYQRSPSVDIEVINDQ